ncbi:hypothetical protein OUZ56_026900 [Daphnia magna]|uniref:Uncharacterized protein n=1 Tax=Daphnia magna TaxID=35525 RepID=A0ABQ9ZN57_9CRUS|nr:hypothetical protein OUZ56_026900 [Daphnia magna]
MQSSQIRTVWFPDHTRLSKSQQCTSTRKRSHHDPCRFKAEITAPMEAIGGCLFSEHAQNAEMFQIVPEGECA